MELFLAKYTVNGVEKTISFKKSEFDEPRAEAWLRANNIKNYVIIAKPREPEDIENNTRLFSGIVGFDITASNIMEAINDGKTIALDTFGGSLFESWKIHDRIKLSGTNPSIGVIGICASAGVQILLATEKRWGSANSLCLIHNPFTEASGDDALMEQTAQQLKQAKNTLAKKYADVSNKDVAEVLSVMQEERFMDAEEMLQWNFIKEIRVITNKPSTNNQNQESMTEKNELTEKVNGMETIINGLKNLFNVKTAVKNVVITDATGLQIDFYELDEESQIEVNAKASIDGADAEGEFVIASGMHEGKTFVFTGGSLTEIKEAETEEPTEEPTEELEALAVENKALKNDVKNLKNAIAKHKAEVSKLECKVKEFKAMVTEGEPIANTPPAKKGNEIGGFKYRSKFN